MPSASKNIVHFWLLAFLSLLTAYMLYQPESTCINLSPPHSTSNFSVCLFALRCCCGSECEISPHVQTESAGNLRLLIIKQSDTCEALLLSCSGEKSSFVSLLSLYLLIMLLQQLVQTGELLYLLLLLDVGSRSVGKLVDQE